MEWIGSLCSTATALFWALAVVMFKMSGETLSPTALNLFKGIVSLVLLVPTLWVMGEPLFPPEQTAGDWLRLGLSGVLGITLADNLFFMALKRIGAGLWAVVECLYLPLMIVFSAIWLGESIGVRGLVGAGLVVTAIIAGSHTDFSLDRPPKDFLIGLLMGAGAMLLLVLSIVLIKPLLDRTSVLWSTFVRMLGGVVGLLLLALLQGDRRQILAVLTPSPAWKLALPASIIGNYLAVITWLAGLKFTLVSVAAILNQLSTIFTFILAAVLLKEPVTRRRMAAIVLAVAGALLATVAG